MGKPLTPDERIDMALELFGKALKNRHALLRKAKQDWLNRTDTPIQPDALYNANELIEMALHDLCIAAEWEPRIPTRSLQEAQSREWHYRALLRTLPPAEFNRLFLNEWRPDERTQAGEGE